MEGFWRPKEIKTGTSRTRENKRDREKEGVSKLVKSLSAVQRNGKREYLQNSGNSKEEPV